MPQYCFAIFLTVALAITCFARNAYAQPDCASLTDDAANCRIDQKVRILSALRTLVVVSRLTEAGRPVAVSYRYDGGDVIIFHSQFLTGSSEPAGGEATKQKLINQIVATITRRVAAGLQVNKVRVIGHSDLEPPSGQEYDIRTNYCRTLPKPVDSKSITCLSLVRAEYAAGLVRLAALQSSLKITHLIVEHDEDFFMQATDRQLMGTLYAALGLGNKVQSLMQQLNLLATYSPRSVRNDPIVRQKITTRLDYFREQFSEFRSAVIVFEN